MPEKKRTSIVFTGDIGFDRYMDKRWKDADLLGKSIRDFICDSDHVVANVEGVMMNAVDDGKHDIFFHSMNPEAIRFLQDIKADIWNISNNHIMDVGLDGLVSTIDFAASMGSRTIGAGRNEIDASEPAYLDEAGGIGMFGVAYQPNSIPATASSPGVFRWSDLNLIGERIKEIKAKCRWCIVVAHGGEEFTCMPSPYTRDLYIKYLELGADAVVGHHPHVPENYELFPDGKMIFYSLGNFIFDTDYQRNHMYTDLGVILKLIFTEDRIDFEPMGIHIVRGDERIEETALPNIFTNIDPAEYELLEPYSAKAFVAEDRRNMIFVDPQKFTHMDQEGWDKYYFIDHPKNYVENEHMDFSIITPLAAKAEEGRWTESKLDKVKEYIGKLL
ncbi:MAG: CapA family protein [Clostridia bacterium]|nr:CapA family protein [Clostridia bacterium]